MLINKENRVILLHNPKTGGRFRRCVCSGQYSQTFRGMSIGQIMVAHTPYWRAEKIVPAFEMYKVFTFIRNPYDRFISAVNYAFDMVFPCSGMVKSADNALDLIEGNEISILFSEYRPWFCPQSLYLGEGVEILRYESVDDWKKLCDIFKYDIHQINIKPHYRLTDKQKERIRNIYWRHDKEVFNIYGL